MTVEEELRAEVAGLRKMVEGFADRIAAQSDLLSRAARNDAEKREEFLSELEGSLLRAYNRGDSRVGLVACVVTLIQRERNAACGAGGRRSGGGAGADGG